MIPAGEPDAEARPRQILIISADIGEGHDLPARAVAREFHDEDPDAQISIVNGLPAMGPVLTKTLRENSAFMFRWVPWLFDFQYRLFMNFAPTRWLSRRLLTAFGRPGPDAADPRPRPRPDRLHVSGRDRGARRAAPQGPAERAVLLVDHRPRRAALLGPPRDRPALHHPPRVGRGGRADRRRRAASGGPSRRPRRRSWRRARAPMRARALGLPADGHGDRGLRRRLGRRRPRRRDRAPRWRSPTRSSCACAGATTRRARASRERSAPSRVCG